MRTLATFATAISLSLLTFSSLLAGGLEIGLTHLQANGNDCRAELNLRDEWPHDIIHFSIDLYILDLEGEAVERQIVDIAPLPPGRDTRAVLPMDTVCSNIGELRIVATPRCRLSVKPAPPDCVAHLRTRSGSNVKVTAKAWR
jgi:hypothetical protein